MSTTAPASNALKGVILAAVAAVAFSLNDLSVKSLSGDYALHEIMLIRSAISLVLILLFAQLFMGGARGIKPNRIDLQVIRAIIVVVANICYFTGLAVMPFADAAAVAFVSPLILTVLSVFFLGEKVGPRRWSAIVFGMLGVIVILRPSSGVFQPAAVLVLISAALYALGYVMSRAMRNYEGALSLTVWMQIAFIFTSGSMGLMFGDGQLAQSDSIFAFLLRAWVWPSAIDWVWLFLTAISVSIGSILITQAFRIAEAGLVAPMEYIGMPLAIFWGATIFGTWPDLQSWVGITMICGAGLYIIWREAQLHRTKT